MCHDIMDGDVSTMFYHIINDLTLHCICTTAHLILVFCRSNIELEIFHQISTSHVTGRYQDQSVSLIQSVQ